MFALLLLAAAATAVPPAPPATAAAPAAATSDVDAIRAVGKRWAEYYAAGRFADIPDLYTVDTVVMPRGRPRIEGRDAMRRAIGGLAAGRRVTIDVTEREVRAIGDYGWYVGDFRVTYTPTEPGAAPVSEAGRSLIIYRRDPDGRWRVHRDIDSPAPQLAAAAAAAPPAAAAIPKVWDPKSRTQAVACDRLTASRYDRTRLAPPVARANIDVPAAIRTCEADLARLPGDPRLHFQLGRLYGYAGDAQKTLYHRRAAADAGDTNAVFLLAYLDWGAAKDDAARCRAERVMKLAADRGNYSAQLTYASFSLEGRFDRCPAQATAEEVAAYVAAARPAVDGFFETRLAEHLAAQAAGTGVEAARRRLVAQQQGVWTGTFRRYDANGALVETLPSEIHVRFPAGEAYDYHQTNILRPPGGKEQRIETYGKWDGSRLRFSSARIDGAYGALEVDPDGLNTALFMRFKDGSGMTVSEIVTMSPDGTRRMRAAQYLVNGRIVRRTLIDEERQAAVAR